ncbi:MAG: cardiolipin synthase [Desulfuromonadaceae bacterium]|nr:cardiolipin synthase [Desulfuromonadaceae bacterium]MDD5106302.1 cardiolipin synthase [Desulfuromonadaceae bacterium]
MDHVLIALLGCSALFLSLLSAGHALLYKRDSRSALVWVCLNLTIPLVGPFFYWCLGINRISRRARSWQESGRWLSHMEIFPKEERAGITPQLPDSAAHLADLLHLEDTIVTTRLRDGNRIVALIGGEEAYPAMLAAIMNAQETINLSSYIFDADGIGAEFVAQLIESAQRGVEVRVIIDALGEKYCRKSPRVAFDGTPVKLVYYLPLRQGAYINLRNHRKLLIVDGREAFTGGMNIRSHHLYASESAIDSIHDVHFSVKGPVVADLQGTFLGDWYFVTGARLRNRLFFPVLEPDGHALACCIADGPDKEFRKIEQIIKGALSCARNYVYIMTPYFVPDREMVSALVTAALRGVDIRIVLPVQNNLPFVDWASRALLWELQVNGIRFFFQPPPFVHTKLLLVDSVWSLIGSANLDTRSLRLNFEINLSVFDSALSATIYQHFEKAFTASHETTAQEIEEYPLMIKLRNNLARLFSPYL